MRWLNYHHLLYFWMVAREGSIAGACARLYLTQPTISKQLARLEAALGEKLFRRAGRGLSLTEAGQTVFRYADEIFSLGRELQESLQGLPVDRPLRLSVGIVESMPELIVHRLIAPALRLPQPMTIVCEQGKMEAMLAQLAVHALDVVLTDAPASPMASVRAFNHFLGECGVSIWAAPKLAAVYRRGFPQSLNGAPFLLPGEQTALRRSLEQWFDRERIRPSIRGEFGDPALLKTFGQHGLGLFAIRTVLERETRRLYRVKLVGRVESIRERFYAISVERKLKHPAVLAISEAAREKLLI